MLFFSKKLLSKKQSGFTIVEMLIVIFIIMLLSGIVFANYKIGGKHLALQRAVSKLAQDFRIVQGMAGQEWAACRINGDYDEDYEYGYGIFFDLNTPTTYLIFADCDGTGNYDSVDDEAVLRIDIEKDIEISQLFSSVPVQELHVVFTPPKPIVYINGSEDGSAEVTLQIQGATAAKKVSINAIGSVDIRDN